MPVKGIDLELERVGVGGVGVEMALDEVRGEIDEAGARPAVPCSLVRILDGLRDGFHRGRPNGEFRMRRQ